MDYFNGAACGVPPVSVVYEPSTETKTFDFDFRFCSSDWWLVCLTLLIKLCTTQELKALSSCYAYPLCSKPFSFCCWSLSAAASFFLFVSLFLFLFAFAPSFVLLCSLCCCLFCSCCFVFALAVSLCSFLFSCAIAHLPFYLPFLSSFPIFLRPLPPSLFFCHCTMLLPSHCAVMFLLLCCFVCCRLPLLIFLFFIVKAPERKFCCFYAQQHKTQASLGLWAHTRLQF